MNEQKTINLNEMSLVELKALGYDLMLKREPVLNNLNALNSDLNVVQQKIYQRSTEITEVQEVK